MDKTCITDVEWSEAQGNHYCQRESIENSESGIGSLRQHGIDEEINIIRLQVALQPQVCAY